MKFRHCLLSCMDQTGIHKGSMKSVLIRLCSILQFRNLRISSTFFEREVCIALHFITAMQRGTMLTYIKLPSAAREALRDSSTQDVANSFTVEYHHRQGSQKMLAFNFVSQNSPQCDNNTQHCTPCWVLSQKRTEFSRLSQPHFI